MPIYLSFIFGTRPELIKLAPVILKARQDSRFKVNVVFTGQHLELVQDAIEFFQIEIDHHFQIMQPGKSLNILLSKALSELDQVYREMPKCDVIVVQGDTTTVLAGALVAFNLNIHLAHVEAGLRSFDLMHPFPEEGNRQLVSRLARWHFAPTQLSAENLYQENISKQQIFITGNTVVDAIHYARELIESSSQQSQQRLERLGLNLSGQHQLVLLTAHRRENFGEGIQNICAVIHELCQRYPELHFAWPVHLNPQVHDIAYKEFSKHPQVHLLKPLDYPDLLAILQAAHFIMTDSGGIQEESPTYQKPVLILRDVTERPEVVEAGCGILVGTDKAKIIKAFSQLMDDSFYYQQHAEVENPFGDGHASERILEQIVQDLKVAE